MTGCEVSDHSHLVSLSTKSVMCGERQKEVNGEMSAHQML